MITLYDYQSTAPGRTISPFVWRVRFALNIKGIKHKTEWLAYASIEEGQKKLGIPPSEIQADGTPRYTVPAIFDPSTNTKLSESTKIIKYLDEAYPDTPQLCASKAAEDAFMKAAFGANWQLPVSFPSNWLLMCPFIIKHLDGESKEKYTKRLEAATNQTVEQFVADTAKQEELWGRSVESYRKVDAWLKEAEKRYGGGPWILGQEVKLPDLALTSAAVWVRLITGGDHDIWTRTAELDGGRWGELWKRIEPYADVF